MRSLQIGPSHLEGGRGLCSKISIRYKTRLLQSVGDLLQDVCGAWSEGVGEAGGCLSSSPPPR